MIPLQGHTRIEKFNSLAVVDNRDIMKGFSLMNHRANFCGSKQIPPQGLLRPTATTKKIAKIHKRKLGARIGTRLLMSLFVGLSLI